ncbi:hypothetical protein KZZ52_30730 [Dactylosporangium sp. AC04546]|uniref:hypothetical protein n=1 Tax=Dactylosporangium sp. AC04546 TaxID=2862460 RepID=UPI001EE12F57|nr:hypothetical protein [Dactylosporangium sp. AC04546]WVK78370.1 hypothetical protein KZZ52_30730 [Dactylosporangium sp. AC04546]
MGRDVNRRCTAVAVLALVVIVLSVAAGALLTWSTATGNLWTGAAGGAVLCLGGGAGIVAMAAVTGDDRSWWALLTLAGAGIALALTVVPAYTGWFADPVAATVTASAPCVDYGPLPAEPHQRAADCVGRARLAATATGADLGWTGCADDLRPGDPVEALVDPLGWLPPQRPPCALSGQSAALPLAALAAYAAALVTLMLHQHQRAATGPAPERRTPAPPGGPGGAGPRSS